MDSPLRRNGGSVREAELTRYMARTFGVKSRNTAHLLAPEARQELLDKSNHARHEILGATRLLVRLQGRRLPEPRGSAIVLRVEERLFLLSARHVFDAFADGTMNIASPPHFAPVTGGLSRALPDDNGKDIFDAAVLSVSPEHVTEELIQGALTVESLEPQTGRNRQVMMLAGFPASRFGTLTGKRVSPGYFQWVGTGMTHEELDSAGYQRRVHVGVDYDPRGAFNADGDTRLGPGLPGVSGSGLWVIPPLGTADINGRTTVLAGIFTEHVPRSRPRFLIGTSVFAHIQLIKNQYPELRSHLP